MPSGQASVGPERFPGKEEPGNLSPGLPICFRVLRGQGPQLGTCSAENTMPGTHFPGGQGCWDLQIAWILSLPPAPDPFASGITHGVSVQTAGTSSSFKGGLHTRLPGETPENLGLQENSV